MRFLLIASAVFLASCNQNKADSTHYSEGQVLKSSKEFKIPRELKERIHQEYIKYVHDEDPSNIATEEELTSQLPREYLEVDMFLKQLNEGTLDENKVFRSPRGGGLVDLSDTVIGEKGSFFVKFKIKDPQAPDEEISNLKSYYLSEVKERLIDGKTYGSGCGSLVDISDAVLKTNKGNGLRVNAKDDRYFHTMAGTYIFVNYAMEKIRLAALRIQDTSISGHECPGKN